MFAHFFKLLMVFVALVIYIFILIFFSLFTFDKEVFKNISEKHTNYLVHLWTMFDD